MKLIKLNQLEYLVLSPEDGVYSKGDVLHVMKLMDSLGVDIGELAFVIAEFERRDHNVGNFGVNKMWTHTCKVDPAQLAA